MQIKVKKQVIDFISLEIFQWKCIFIDSRILLYVSDIFSKIIDINLKKFLNRESSINSVWVVLPESLWFSLWAFYPNDKNTLEKYENLLKQGIELDIFVISDNDYLNLTIINFWNITFSPDYLKFLWKNIFWYDNRINQENILKDYNEKWIFNLISIWWFRFLNANLKWDIKKIIYDAYYNINLLLRLKNFIDRSDILHWKLLYTFFIPDAIYKIKNQLLFFSILLKEWYNKIEDIATWKILKKDEVEYIKNISLIEWSMYSGFVEKVYNKYTANSFLKWNIMIAKNTNPEFLNAFYNAKMVCADTKSELSHAAITCRELKIPLALWCDNLFFSVENNDFITVNTKEKIIKIWKHDSILK